jgi:hypothetical protein
MIADGRLPNADWRSTTRIPKLAGINWIAKRLANWQSATSNWQ